jgi:uncharacterized protein YcfJ
MKRIKLLTLAVLGTVLAGPAFARYENSFFDYANVLSVDRVATQAGDGGNITREECKQEPVDEHHPGMIVQHQSPPVVNEVTGERTVTTRTEEVDGYDTHTVKEHCSTQTEYRQAQTVAFDVVYRYNHQDYHDRIGHDPGSRVRVRVDDGHVELAE